MIMTVVYISEDSTPADTPTPATISPTSPREIIPIPTLNAFVLSFKNIIEGSPHPATFVPTAMAVTIPERNNTLRFTPVRNLQESSNIHNIQEYEEKEMAEQLQNQDLD